MFARTMADVDADEDAELRRLDRGVADDDAGVLLFEAAALLDGTRGVVRLHPNRLEWISDGAAEASVQLEVAHVASFQQSKYGKPKPKLKVTATPAAGGVSFVFDMTEADPTSTAERDRLRDTLKAQMDGLQHELVAQRSLLEQRMQEIAGEVCIVDAGDSNQLVNHVLARGVGRHPRWWRKRVVVGSLVVVRQRYLSPVANQDPGRGRRLQLPWNCECLEGLLWPSFMDVLREAVMSSSG
jgi:hypothetical protein